MMLELHGVQKTFNPGTVNEKKALTGIDLALEQGDFVTIVGSNGAGKSTLFNATPKLLLLDEHTAALDPATADKVLELTKKIVAENNITCLMITHNMHAALELGNRTLMMDGGRIVLDVGGAERAGMTVDDLLDRFAKGTGHMLDNDRILLSKEQSAAD